MKITRFEPSEKLIFVTGTASSQCVIIPEILDELGYSPRDGEAVTSVRSAVAEEPGYLIRVARFAALGHHRTDFRVHAHDLPDGFGLDGLLGLSFLHDLNYEVRSREGRILVERAK